MPLYITSTTKSARVRPTKWLELRTIIKQELERQGPDADLNFIDTSKITAMSSLFFELNIRNIKIDKWNMSNVESTRNMFVGHKEFTGSGLENWDVSRVKDMAYMFFDCNTLNCNLSNWNISNVTDMNAMFYCCTSFDCDLSSWCISDVLDKCNMFTHCPIDDSHKPKF